MDGGDGRIRDISAVGVYFLTNRQLAVDAKINFVMLSPEPGKANIWCEGRVVRVEPQPTGQLGVGIEVESFHCQRLPFNINSIASLGAGPTG